MGIGIEFTSVTEYFLLLAVLYAAGSMILRYFHFPAKLIITILSNSLIGLGLLILSNVFLSAAGVSLPINPFNLAFTAIFGFPGAVCLILLRFIL